MVYRKNSKVSTKLIAPDSVKSRLKEGRNIKLFELDEPHYLGHRKRMRDKFLLCPSSLQDYELVEMLLYYVFHRKDTKRLAKAFLREFVNIRNLIFSEKADLERVKGAGDGCITLISVIREIFVRASFDKIKETTVISSSADVINYYKNVFGGKKHEQLRIMFLDNKNELIADEILQEGTINQIAIYFRMIVKKALEFGASALIMAHNHPSGDPTPSRQDIIATRALMDIVMKLDLVLLDHIIIGKDSTFSMKERGVM